MNNYISINNQKIALTDEQVKQIIAVHAAPSIRLSDVAARDTVKIGSHDMIVLDQLEDTTVLICKDLYRDDQEFGKDNNYNGSYVDTICDEFANEIAAVVGEDNIILHTVDLTADDGLNDYGEIQRRASLLTADMYRRYVAILDAHNPDAWWWLVTAYSTPAHGNDSWVKCVSPSGYVFNINCSINDYGVRPFCILKSNIFVSK